MKKPTLITLLYFVLTSLRSFSQGEWIEEDIDPETGLRTGKIEINGVIATINSGADLSGINLEGANLQLGEDLGEHQHLPPADTIASRGIRCVTAAVSTGCL